MIIRVRVYQQVKLNTLIHQLARTSLSVLCIQTYTLSCVSAPSAVIQMVLLTCLHTAAGGLLDARTVTI